MVSIATKSRRIAARREFAVSGKGVEEFQRHLETLRKAPTHLITDLAEEDFRLDTVPHVGAGDREAIFARRLAQIYRNTPYRHALAQGRESEGRRDDRVLYTAVTNPEVLRPWLEAIERLAVPLAGIHSSALFSSALLKELDLEFPHTLLVTFTPGEALRQTYFRSGEFKFSRLTPLDLEEGQTLGAMMAEDTTRTWQYLDSLRHFAADDRLEVCVLVHPRERAELEPHLQGFAQIQYRILDIEQVGAKLGMKAPPQGPSAEEVLVHLFLMRPGQNHFATPELRRHAALRTTRLALNQISAAVLVVGLAWGAFNMAALLRGNAADDRMEQQRLAYIREYNEVTRGLPSFGVGGSAMRDAVSFYDASIKSFPTINEFLRPISEVLLGHPHVRLNQLSWHVSDDPAIVPSLALAPPRNPPPVKSVARGGEAPPGPPPPESANPAFTTARFEIAAIEGTIRVANNDFRDALERVEKLAAEISRLRGYKAQVLESPLDLRPALALQGRLVAEEPSTMEPRFVLRILRDRRSAS